jgi:Na+-translocating ferredoxin:NAD+ oxidoreductase RnfG subunit
VPRSSALLLMLLILGSTLALESLGQATAGPRAAWARWRDDAPLRSLAGTEALKSLTLEASGALSASLRCTPTPALLVTTQGEGWGGPLILLSRFEGDPEGEAHRVLRHEETPRYGGRYLHPRSDLAGLDGWTGATITARALRATQDQARALFQDRRAEFFARCEANP